MNNLNHPKYFMVNVSRIWMHIKDKNLFILFWLRIQLLSHLWNTWIFHTCCSSFLISINSRDSFRWILVVKKTNVFMSGYSIYLVLFQFNLKFRLVAISSKGRASFCIPIPIYCSFCSRDRKHHLNLNNIFSYTSTKQSQMFGIAISLTQ